MKKILLVLMLGLSIGTMTVGYASSAPKHRYHPKQEVKQEASQKADDKDENAIEAYSDTTSADDDVQADSVDYAADSSNHNSSVYNPDNYDNPLDYMTEVFGKSGLVLIVIFGIIFSLLFVLAPFIIMYLILRYIYKRHQDRVRLTEMAMQAGVQIPENARPIDRQSDEYLTKRGVRNVFLGLGLGAMFGFWGWSFMVGISALVLFYGLGQIVIGNLPTIKGWLNQL